MDEPLYPHASLGYRCWRLEDAGEGLRLYPLKRNGARGALECWTPGLNHADCFAFGSRATETDHQPPERACQCGIHAYYSYKDAKLQYQWARARSAPTSRFVFGAIAGAGQHQLHADGFRCRQAVPLGLFKPRWDREQRRLVEMVAEYYQLPTWSGRRQVLDHADQAGAVEVPVLSRPTRESQAAHYPPPWA